MIALDYGSARTGVAVSDATGTLARPVGVIERAASPAGLRQLAELVAAEGAERVVVGLPLTLRGAAGAQAQETAAFVESLEALLDVPVESFDERFTTSLAASGPSSKAPEDARGCAPARELAGMDEPRGVIPPRPGRPERRPPQGQIVRRRALAALLLFGSIALALWLGVSAFGDNETEEPPPATTVAAPKPTILRIVFPEGFTRKEMAKRVAEVRQIAKTKRKVTPKLSGNAYATAAKAAQVPVGFRKDAKGSEGFLFPATYEFTPKTTSAQLVEDQLEFFDANWAKVNLADARKKNLTPYDVLIIASMVEKETIAPDERPKVAAVIYNRLKAGMPLGIDATIRYGLDVPGTEALRVSQLESDNPYNTRNRQGLPPTPIANPGLASMQAAAHPAKVNYLYFVRKPDKVHHFFTASESEFYAKACEYGFGCG